MLLISLWGPLDVGPSRVSPAEFGADGLRSGMEHMRKAKSKKPDRERQIGPEPVAEQGNGTRSKGRARGGLEAEVSLETTSLADAQRSLGSIKSRAGLDLTEKVKDLLRLAKE